LVILEGKVRGKRAKGRPRRMWFDDVRQWTMLKDYTEVKRKGMEGHNTSTFYIRR